MHSRAKISDHPIHPMLVAFPIVFYTSTVAALIAFAFSTDPFWFRAALTANVAGVVMALIAAIPGAIDLFAGVPQASRARSTGLLHMSFNLAALALFVVSAVVLWNRWYARDTVALDGIAPLAFAIAGLVATAIGASLGWVLVQTYHVGLSPNRRHRVRHAPRHPRVDEMRTPTHRPSIGRTPSHVRN
jgi:uncharacterized membrane protein